MVFKHVIVCGNNWGEIRRTEHSIQFLEESNV